MGNVTIRDIARKAKVGVGTVSRVLNDSPAVSEETRRIVLEAIQELDYAPSPIARRLSLGRTLTIAVVLPFLTLPAFVERLRGVQHVLANSEYDLVLYSVGNPTQRDTYFKDLSRPNRADGLLFISLPPNDVQAQRLLRSEVPNVMIGSVHKTLHHVRVDDFYGGELATQHLIDFGHRDIGLISDYIDTPWHFVPMRERFLGYQKALEDAGIPFNPEFIAQGPHGRDEACTMAMDLLKKPERPSAIFACSDTQAIGVLDAAIKLGISVPDELSVVGYDGIRDAEYVDLTTVEQPLFDSGVEGARLLLENIADPLPTPKVITLPIELVVRGTTAPPGG